MMTGNSILLAGAVPGQAAGNSVSTDTLRAALASQGDLGLLTHEISPFPRLRQKEYSGIATLALGVQPVCVHGEAALAGWMYASAIRRYTCGWAVNSRYASALHAAGLPYVIWEPTRLRDELAISDLPAIWRSGRGSGLGMILHKGLLPLDEMLERKLYRDATAVLPMSEYTRERILAIGEISPTKVRVLPHPPAPDFLEALERARDEAAPTCDSNECAKLRLLFVGRVDDPRKNFALLSDAFARLYELGIPATLSVIGPHGDQWRSRLSVTDVKAVKFFGRVSNAELARAFLDHDVLVLPSRQEGFGIVVAEALHAGLPVVATHCGGPEHMIRESGGGILVEDSASAIASAIRVLAADRRRRCEMSERGRAYARHELSTERFCERVASELALLRASSHVDKFSPS
jgi:glycosyltransferase involved in cell wall biosynthesis